MLASDPRFKRLVGEPSAQRLDPENPENNKVQWQLRAGEIVANSEEKRAAVVAEKMRGRRRGGT